VTAVAATTAGVTSVIDAYRRHLSAGRASLAELTGGVVEVRSEGSLVYDTHGEAYLDCGGYGVFILGHCHPRVTEAVVRQVRRHPMSSRILLEPAAAEAASALAAVAPRSLSRVHFVNSGAEAVEAAVKLARLHGKTHLISAVGGFHGKTMGALSLTARELYQKPFRPLLPDVRHVPFGDLRALERALAGARRRGCVVLEPVQGENGVVIPPAGYLLGAQRLCREYGALLVLDEIQTGLGRLGTWWGADREGIRPDILLVGKNLSGGVVPVAAMLATDAVYAPLSDDPFLHSSTFAAAPVAMAAARAAIETIRSEEIVERAGRLGVRLLAGLRAVLADRGDDLGAEVRGSGLLLGVDLAEPGLAAELALELLNRHVLVNHSLNAQHVIRFTPPAVLTEGELGWLLDACGEAVAAVAAARLRASGRSVRGRDGRKS
jgi:putrescine aminotransferase